jgi:hypothetical protein
LVSTDKDEQRDRKAPAEYSDLRALFVNCTLKR